MTANKTDHTGANTRTDRVPALMCALVLAAIALAYAPGINGPFIYDDLESIPDNPNIRTLLPLGRTLSAPPATTLSGRPAVSLSFAVNHALHGLHVRGYRVTNVVIHALTALVVFGVVRRTLRSARFRGAFDTASGWLALAITAIWALHPLLSETVTYVVQRTELLGGFFYVLTLYLCIRGWASTRRARIWHAGAVVACALGMASKEMVITAPVVVLAYDAVFISSGIRAALRRHAGLFAGLAACWILLAILMAPGHRTGTVGFGHGVSALDCLRTQAGVIVWYLRLVCWPAPLSITYDDWPIARNLADAWAAGLLVATLLAVTAIALRRRPALGFCGFWVFVILSPTSSFIPIITEPAGERRMYLPLIAVVSFIVIVGWRLVRGTATVSRNRRLVFGAIATVVACGLGWATAMRNLDYRSAESIWRATLTARPNSPTALMNFGNAVLASDPAAAIGAYRRAVEIKPSFAKVHYNLANALAHQQAYAEAVASYRKALELDADYIDAHYNLGIALAAMNQLESAVDAYHHAIELAPRRVDMRNNLAVALNRLGRRDAAIATWRAALRIDDSSTVIRVNVADALLDAGSFTEAAAMYRETLRLDPAHADARFSLAIALASLGQRTDAVSELRRVVAEQPNHAGARQMLTDLSTVEGSDAP